MPRTLHRKTRKAKLVLKDVEVHEHESYLVHPWVRALPIKVERNVPWRSAIVYATARKTYYLEVDCVPVKKVVTTRTHCQYFLKPRRRRQAKDDGDLRTFAGIGARQRYSWHDDAHLDGGARGYGPGMHP